MLLLVQMAPSPWDNIIKPWGETKHENGKWISPQLVRNSAIEWSFVDREPGR